MKVDVVDCGGDVVLKIHLTLIFGRRCILWMPTRIKMAPIVPATWLAESSANEEAMLESVNILINLAGIQYYC